MQQPLLPTMKQKQSSNSYQNASNEFLPILNADNDNPRSSSSNRNDLGSAGRVSPLRRSLTQRAASVVVGGGGGNRDSKAPTPIIANTSKPAVPAKPVSKKLAPKNKRSRKSVGAFRKQKGGIKDIEAAYDTWKGRIGVHMKVDEYDLRALEAIIQSMDGWEYVNHYDVIRLWQRPLTPTLYDLGIMSGFTTDEEKYVPESTTSQGNNTGTANNGENNNQDAANSTSIVIHHQNAATLEVFIFSFGAVVFWNFPNAKSEENWLETNITCHDQSCGSSHNEEATDKSSDDLEFVYGDVFAIKRDLCNLATHEPGEKLAVSFGLAKSSLLTIYEWMLEQTIERNSHIPEELARTGTIQMAKMEIGREIGRIFLVSHGINLDSNLQDTPEEFWEDDRFEDTYAKTLLYFEIHKRHNLVNNRLTMLHDLHRVLSEEVQSRHEVRLEWIVIWLVFLDVLFECYHAFVV